MEKRAEWWCQYCHKTIQSARKRLTPEERRQSNRRRMRRYLALNGPARAAYKAAWYRRHRDRLLPVLREKTHQWYQANRDRKLAYMKAYRARRKGAAYEVGIPQG